MALIGFILIMVYLLVFADSGQRLLNAQRNAAYALDRKTHNYNDDLQEKIRCGKDDLHYPHYQELWELVKKYKLSSDIAKDVVMAKKLRDKGYDFDPYSGNFQPMMCEPEAWKDAKKATRVREEYRQKVYDLVDKYTEDDSKDCIKGFKYDEKVTYDINGLKTVEYRLPHYKY